MPASPEEVWAALAWGTVSSVGLLVGAIAGSFFRMPHHAIAMAMSVGAGLLLAGVSLKVAADAIGIAGPVAAALSLLLGAAVFSAGNALLARFGAAPLAGQRSSSMKLHKPTMRNFRRDEEAVHSPCSIHFGTNLTTAAPGSAQMLLIVSDIQAARDELAGRGVAVSEVFHYAGFNRVDPEARLSGPAPDRRSYGSFVSFGDPDGNTWLLQEITTRLPGRIDPGTISFNSASDLASAFRRAEAAHGEHEKRTGQRDANWPEWYAAYMVAEQAGTELPT
jgi:hypothetical protein